MSDTQDAPQAITEEGLDIVTEITAYGGRVYLDPKLAEIGQALKLLRTKQHEINNEIARLEKIQAVRLKAIHKLGPLTQYPTADQRNFITTFEAAIQLGNVVMLDMSYKLCADGGVDKTNYRYKGDEPIAVAYARVRAELAGA